MSIRNLIIFKKASMSMQMNSEVRLLNVIILAKSSGLSLNPIDSKTPNPINNLLDF
jgi:hypothetical protein